MTAAVAILSASAAIAAQHPSTSAEAARDLAWVLERSGAKTISAIDPTDANAFVAALYVGGRDLLVMRARYPAPARLAQEIRDRRDVSVFSTLRGTPLPEGKFSVRDIAADGLLSVGAAETDVDVITEGGMRPIRLNGNVEAQGTTATEYDAAIARADAEYGRLLRILTEAARARLSP